MVKWWSVAGITLDLEIALVKMRSSKTGVFVKGIFKGSHLKNFKFILIGNMHGVGQITLQLTSI